MARSTAVASCDDDHLGRRAGSACSRSTRCRALGQHRPLVEVALVGDLIGVDGGRLGQQQAAEMRMELPCACALWRARPAASASRTAGWQIRSSSLASAPSAGHRLRSPARLGKISSPISSRSWPGDHRVLDHRRAGGDHRGAQHADVHPRARSNLKFSATRPSNSKPAAGSAGSAKRTASPVLSQPSSSKALAVSSGALK